MIELLQPADGLMPGNYAHLRPEDEARLICAGLARAVDGPVPALSARQVVAFNHGQHMMPNGRFEQFDPMGRVYLSTSGIVRSAPSKLYAIGCNVAAGTIKVYDSTTASGRVVVDTMPLAVGRYQIGNMNGEPLSVGCYVELSDPAAWVFLVVD